VARGSTKKEKYANDAVVDKEFISCEQDGICPVTEGLQMKLKLPTITVNT
jgi:hypothetical protein